MQPPAGTEASRGAAWLQLLPRLVCSDLSWVSCLQTFGFLGVGETARGLKACCGVLLTAKARTKQEGEHGAGSVCWCARGLLLSRRALEAATHRGLA